MGDVIVTGVAPVVKDTMPTGVEEVSLSFARVRQEYVLQNQQGGSGGTVTASFDIQQNCEA
jgi:type VI secretion system secreted protein Hcp